MASVTLTTKASRGKYGVVTELNTDRTVKRSYRITAAELAALHADPKGVPPGITRATWEAGLAYVAGKDIDVADAQAQPDGSVIFKLDERTVQQKLVEAFVRLPAGSYTGTFPAITVTDMSALQAVLPGRLKFAIDRVVSIVNGVVTYS